LIVVFAPLGIQNELGRGFADERLLRLRSVDDPHKEHLGLPNKKEAKDSAIAYRTAAHAADLAMRPLRLAKFLLCRNFARCYGRASQAMPVLGIYL
jgi:hypothetical protein